MEGYFAKLDSWFGDTDYVILHHWSEPTASAPTVFSVVKSGTEIMFMRVHNVVGRLQVHCDKRTPISEV